LIVPGKTPLLNPFDDLRLGTAFTLKKIISRVKSPLLSPSNASSNIAALLGVLIGAQPSSRLP